MKKFITILFSIFSSITFGQFSPLKVVAGGAAMVVCASCGSVKVPVINVTLMTVTSQPSNAIVHTGDEVTTTATFAGGIGTIHRYSKVDGVLYDSSSSIGRSYSSGTHTVQLFAFDNYGNNATSNVATISVYNLPTFSTNPSSQSIYQGTSLTSAAMVTGGAPNVTYNWYLNGVAQNVNSVNFTHTYTSTSTLYATAIDGLGATTTSTTAAIAVTPTLAISSQPNPVTLNSGQTGSFTVVAINGYPSYLYQWYKNSTAISGATSATYNFTANYADSGAVYQVRVTDQQAHFVFSNNALLAVHDTTSGAPTVFHFQFTTDDSTYRTSAVVLDGSNNLVRTIWDGVTYSSGSHDSFWDYKDDLGRYATNGSYHVKVLKTGAEANWLGTVGNSSDSLTGVTKHHGTQFSGLEVMGTSIIAFAAYCEGNYPAFRMNTAHPNTKQTLGRLWGGTGIHSCNDGSRAYSLVYNGIWFVWGVDSSGAFHTFTSGKGISDNRSTVDTFTSVVAPAVAVQKNGNNDYLFISVPDNNYIRVYNKNTGALVRTNTISGSVPDDLSAMACDNTNGIWISNKKFTVNSDGSFSSTGITFSGFYDIASMRVSDDNTKVAIIDNDLRSNQIKIYSNTTGSYVDSLGIAGGYAHTSDVTFNRFAFQIPDNNSAVQTDVMPYVSYDGSNGLWFEDCYNYRNLHFNSSKTYQEKIAFLPPAYITYMDANSPTHIYAEYNRFTVSNMADPQHSWTLDKCYGGMIPSTVEVEGQFNNVFSLSNGRTYTSVRNRGDVGSTANQYIDITDSVRFIHANDFDYQSNMDKFGGISARSIYGSSRQVVTGFSGLDPVYSTASNYIGFNVPSVDSLPTETKQFSIFPNGSLPLLNTTNSNGFHIGYINAGATGFKVLTGKSTGLGYLGTYVKKPSVYVNGNGINVFAAGSMSTAGAILYTNKHDEFYNNGGQTSFHALLDSSGLGIGVWGDYQDNYHNNGVECPAWLSGNALRSQIALHSDGYYYLCFGDESRHGGVHLARIKFDSVNLKYENFYCTKTANTPYVYPFTRMLDGYPTNWTVDATDAKFTIEQGRYSYDDFSPKDLTVAIAGFTNNDFTRQKVIKRILPYNGHDWAIEGYIQFPSAFSKSRFNPTNVISIEINDTANKKICGVEPQIIPNFSPTASSFFTINNTPAWEDPTRLGLSSSLHYFRIFSSGGQVSLTFMGNTVSVPISDSTSNLLAPNIFQINLFGLDSYNTDNIVLRDLNFKTY